MHPEILSLSLFMFVTSCSPGPNNVVASHSGFNHGIKKSIPLMLGVIFGFTTILAVVNFGLINIFNIYPFIQKTLTGTGTIFLIYLSYKISFSKSQNKNEDLKPVNFIETFLYQFLNPNGVIVAIIAVSTYTELME
jgi:Putative threonine efflux protein